MRCRVLTTSLVAVAVAFVSSTGCQKTVAYQNRALEFDLGPTSDIPRELNKTTLTSYVIEPPDILLIEAVKVVPKPPQRIEPLDVLQLVVVGTLPDAPIQGPYAVESDGMIDLGFTYGAIRVAGLTLPEARKALLDHLLNSLSAPEVYMTLIESAGEQQIQGEHLVGPDGTINLGTYGSVQVTGMTIDQARDAIETHLEQFLEEPEISVDVFSYNSKVYYIITEGAGLGDQIIRIPITGNEMVLDAITQVNGLSQRSSKRIWIARPRPDGTGCDQILPVNYDEVVKGGSSATNWQIMPGDRVFIAQDSYLAFTALIQKLVAPWEQLTGSALLLFQTIQTGNRFPDGSFSGINQNQFGF